MKEIYSYKTGLTLGVIFTAGHFIWGILVMTGVATKLIDWVFWLHFLNNPFLVLNFDTKRWLMLLFLSFAAGFILGVVGSYIWKKLPLKKT